MTLTLAKIARWHARQVKATAGADRDFHTEAAKLLRDLANRRAKHGRNIAAALAKRKAQGKPLGRSRIDPTIEEAIKTSRRAAGKGIHAMARGHGFGSGTVQRVKDEMARTVKCVATTSGCDAPLRRSARDAGSKNQWCLQPHSFGGASSAQEIWAFKI
jgi:hypothetical protein